MKQTLPSSSATKRSPLQRFEATQLFREHEIWPLFKYAAFGEALGWAFLLYGITAEVYHMPGVGFALPIGGSLHGLGFLAYAGIVLAGYPSLGWSRRQAVVGTFASVPPFGSLFFELYAAKQRQRRQFGSLRRLRVQGIIARDDQVLAVQTIDSPAWQLPGGEIMAGETTQAALMRLLEAQFGLKPVVGPMTELSQTPDADGGSLMVTYMVTNTSDYYTLDLVQLAQADQTVDELAFVVPGSSDATAGLPAVAAPADTASVT